MRRKKQETTHEVRQRANPAPGWATGWWWEFGVLCLILATMAIGSPAQDKEPLTSTFTTLYNFDLMTGPGAPPVAGLIQGFDGNLYATAGSGLSVDAGSFFNISPGGTLTVLYDFCSRGDCADGSAPDGLVLGSDGNFYGTAAGGGLLNFETCAINGCGTFFRMSQTGVLKTLYSFCAQANCADGANPTGGLVQGSDGNFYGTTAPDGGFLPGTVFKIAPSGALTTLHTFSGADGAFPTTLLQATDGNFYGITVNGGANDSPGCFYSFPPGCGTVFKMTPAGVLTTLYSFCAQSNCTDGSNPLALLQAINGNLYGVTLRGGANSFGTLFKITSAGVLTTLYNFCAQPNCADGSDPQALIAASNSGFYGVTSGGGAHGDGTIFGMTPAGSLRVLHSFDGTDGSYPQFLSQAPSGTFYGATYEGGAYDYGTVFSLSVGISAYVETLPTSGKVGASVKILGTDLTGATSVSFNGTSAVFTVVSRSSITTTVPEGATTGFVTVTTPTGTLKSNVKFQVRP